MSENRGYLEKTRQKQKRGKKGVKRMNFEISRKTRCMYVGETKRGSWSLRERVREAWVTRTERKELGGGIRGRQ